MKSENEKPRSAVESRSGAADEVRETIPKCPPLPDIPNETDEQKAARYERALRAISTCTLMGADFGDWVQQVCEDVLDGLEAECWNCGTIAHDGPCVGAEPDE